MAVLTRLRMERVVGAPMVLKDQRTPVTAGPAPFVGCERSSDPSAGARGGHPTTAIPKLHRGASIVKERRENSVHGWTVTRHSQLVGPRGAVTSSWAIRVRGSAADETV